MPSEGVGAAVHEGGLHDSVVGSVSVRVAHPLQSVSVAARGGAFEQPVPVHGTARGGPLADVRLAGVHGAFGDNVVVVVVVVRIMVERFEYGDVSVGDLHHPAQRRQMLADTIGHARHAHAVRPWATDELATMTA